MSHSGEALCLAHPSPGSVNTQRLHDEFGPPRETLLAQLPALIDRFGAHFAGVTAR